MLGIPNVLDRLIQQAIHQVLSPHYEKDFSPSSYGFRPGRNAWQAIEQAHGYVKQGHNIVVDIDLEKFFDQVNHDILMARLAKRILDKRLLGLIRRYLQSGMMMGGLVSQREKGTPQGSPLSPLLSNILLDDLDKELDARGHRFCRYADDCQVYVKSRRAGRRVKESMTAFLETRLKLPVNRDKSRVVAASRSSFLGYGFLGMATPRIRCSTETVKRFKRRVRQLTRGHDRDQAGSPRQEPSRLDELLSAGGDAPDVRRPRQLDPKPSTDVPDEAVVQAANPSEEDDSALASRGRCQGVLSAKRWWFLAQLHHTRFAMNNRWWHARGFRGVSFYMKRFATLDQPPWYGSVCPYMESSPFASMRHGQR